MENRLGNPVERSPEHPPAAVMSPEILECSRGAPECVVEEKGLDRTGDDSPRLFGGIGDGSDKELKGIEREGGCHRFSRGRHDLADQVPDAAAGRDDDNEVVEDWPTEPFFDCPTPRRRAMLKNDRHTLENIAESAPSVNSTSCICGSDLSDSCAMATIPPPGQILRLLRPKQWLKNSFVFAPLIFARELFEPSLLLLAVRAFGAFCLTASAVYVINDIADAEADRVHPVKKHRPIAAGTITVPQALGIAVILLGIVVALTSGMDVRFLFLLAAYFVLNLAYSFWLRSVFLLDVFIIAAGFMLRVVGGAYAISVPVSSWLVLCSLFISLFLGFAKRRGELVQWQATGETAKRKTLLHYRVDFLDQLLTVAAAGTVISYALYTVAPRTTEAFGTDRLIYTTVFVIYGIFRYMYLVHTTASIENPTNAVTSDLPIIVNALLWIAACVAIIYTGGVIPWLSR